MYVSKHLEICGVALWQRQNLTALQQKQKEGTIVPTEMELESSAFVAVTDGGAMEVLMVLCIKALL